MKTKYITCSKEFITNYLCYLLDKIDSVYYQEVNISIKRILQKIENNTILE